MGKEGIRRRSHFKRIAHNLHQEEWTKQIMDDVKVDEMRRLNPKIIPQIKNNLTS